MNTTSQNHEILNALLNGERLTWQDAYKRFGCSCLNSRISNLRNDMKIPVQSVRIKVTDKDGETKSVCQYYLEPSYINEYVTLRVA